MTKYLILILIGIGTPLLAWMISNSYNDPSEPAVEIYSDNLKELQPLEGKRVHLNGFCIPDNMYYCQVASFEYRVAPVFKCQMGSGFASSRVFLTIESQQPYSLDEKWRKLENDTHKLFTGILVREAKPIDKLKGLIEKDGIRLDDQWCFQVLVDYNPWDNIFYAAAFYGLAPAGCILAIILLLRQDRKKKNLQ